MPWPATCSAATSRARSLPEVGHHDAQRGHHAPRRADRHRHRAGAQAHLLDRGRVAVARAPGASWRRSSPGWVIVYGVIRRRSASTAVLHLRRRVREQHLADAGRVQRQPRADAADHRHRRVAGAAGRGRAPRCRRGPRGARWPGWRRTGRAGTARRARAARSAPGASSPRSQSRRPTTYSPDGRPGQRAPGDQLADQPVGGRQRQVRAGRPARSGSAARWSSSKAPSSASAREVTVAPGVETLPAMAPVLPLERKSTVAAARAPAPPYACVRDEPSSETASQAEVDDEIAAITQGRTSAPASRRPSRGWTTRRTAAACCGTRPRTRTTPTRRASSCGRRCFGHQRRGRRSRPT